MTSEQLTKAKQYIQDTYPSETNTLIDELTRYHNTNEVRNGNKMTFVSLSHQVRTAIAVTKGSTSGNIVTKRDLGRR